MVNKKRLIKLLQKLIQIDSQNPPGNEKEIASFVQRYLSQIGAKSKIYGFKEGRLNVIGYLSFGKNRPSLLLTPHLDTVPAGKSWRFNPFNGKIQGNKIFGLGATDCKGNLACALEAMTSLVEEKIVLPYNLVLAATADEESGSNLGLIPLLEKGILKPAAALVLDADDFSIIVSQKGLVHLKVKIQGRKAHGAYPWQGINAIEKALAVLQELKAQKFRYKRNPYLRAPTVNIGTIKGGDKVNVVADWCEFELDFRFLPGSSEKELLRKLKKIIQRHTRKFKIEIEGIQKPYLIAKEHPLVKYLSRAMQNNGMPVRIEGSEGATVITFFQHKNIPAIATGFGCLGQAHVADEYAKIGNLYKGSRILVDFLKDFRFESG